MNEKDIERLLSFIKGQLGNTEDEVREFPVIVRDEIKNNSTLYGTMRIVLESLDEEYAQVLAFTEEVSEMEDPEEREGAKEFLKLLINNYRYRKSTVGSLFDALIEDQHPLFRVSSLPESMFSEDECGCIICSLKREVALIEGGLD